MSDFIVYTALASIILFMLYQASENDKKYSYFRGKCEAAEGITLREKDFNYVCYRKDAIIKMEK